MAHCCPSGPTMIKTRTTMLTETPDAHVLGTFEDKLQYFWLNHSMNKSIFSIFPLTVVKNWQHSTFQLILVPSYSGGNESWFPAFEVSNKWETMIQFHPLSDLSEHSFGISGLNVAGICWDFECYQFWFGSFVATFGVTAPYFICSWFLCNILILGGAIDTGSLWSWQYILIFNHIVDIPSVTQYYKITN